jgi:hypothetical protein
MSDGWMQRMSRDGLHAVSGSKRLTYDDVEIADGAAPQFAGSDVFYTSQPVGMFMKWTPGTTRHEVIRQQGFNFFDVADDGRWVGYRADPPRLIWFDNVEWSGWADGDISNTRWAARVQATGGLHAGTGNGQGGRLIDPRATTDVRIEDDVLVWRVGEHIYAQRIVDGPVENWGIEGISHYWPVPVRVGGKQYVLTHTEDLRLLLYEGKNGQTHGHVVATGVTDFPDAKAIDATHVRVRWSVGGQPKEAIVDITKPTVDLRRRPPVLDTSGTVLNLWDYIIPEPGMFPRIQAEPRGHAMDCKFDGRNFWLMPFGEFDHWVRWVIEPGDGPTGGKMTLREDRSQDEQSTGDYSFTKGHWLDQFMAPKEFGGHVISNQNNYLVRYEPDGCQIVDVHRYPFKAYVYQHWLGVDCGPDLGVRDVVVTCYDPGTDLDTKEYGFWAKGAGNYRFQNIKQPVDTLLFEKWFELFGGPHLEPTQGCWKREHLDLTPENWQESPKPPTEEHMTENDIRLVSTPVPPDIFLGALLRFRNEVLLDRDKVGDDSMGAGALMYFVPNYNSAVVELLARQGIPTGSPQQVFEKWAGMSSVGLARAADHYNREQKGDTGGGGNGGGGNGGGGGTPVEGGIRGQLRIEASAFVDDGGPVLPILCHFGDALSRWSRGHQGDVAATLDDIAAAGYHGIRFWSTLGLDNSGDGFWAGRAVGPTYVDGRAQRSGEDNPYWAHVEAFLTALRDRGLVCQLSQGDVRAVAIPDRRAFAEQMADVVNRVGAHVVALFEGANESRDTGEPDAGRLAQFVSQFHERCPSPLLALSAYTGTEDVAILNDFSRPPANLYVVHSYRGGRFADKIRHIFSIVYEGKPQKRLGWNGEGPGYGDLVSAIDNKHEIDANVYCALAIMALITRQGYVYFSGPGVISDAGERLQDMPGFREVPTVRALLPADVMRFGEIWHGGDDRPWSPRRAFRAVGEIRADHVVEGNRFVCLIYGAGGLNLPQNRALRIDRDVTFGDKARLVVGEFA